MGFLLIGFEVHFIHPPLMPKGISSQDQEPQIRTNLAAEVVNN